jgi:hypothetical protein
VARYAAQGNMKSDIRHEFWGRKNDLQAALPTLRSATAFLQIAALHREVMQTSIY